MPQELWETVRTRRKEMHRTWPGGNGERGFSGEQGSRQAHFPTHLLAGSMTCGSCGATIAQVSGKNGGYYGCLAATKGACENKTLVRRTLAESVILDAVKDELADPEHVAYVLRRVEEEVAKLRSDLPDTLKLKEAELSAAQRRLANFVDFIGEGRGSQALAKANTYLSDCFSAGVTWFRVVGIGVLRCRGSGHTWQGRASRSARQRCVFVGLAGCSWRSSQLNERAW